MAEKIPTHIGRYKVIDELGRGGFGRVYRAFDPSVGRPVAIKLLTERGKDVLTRFRNEATVAGNLRHENIVTVYEYGEFEGQPFLAMEYLEGEDLQQIVGSHKPLTLLEKCRIMSQVAEGLDCAHRAGVVHRDVKPANIMVRRDGVVKIMDFGIARVTRDTEATRLTQQGYVLGTLIYMAPEQFAGAEIDALCDIFAYGVVYFELLTGRHPFEAPDSRALMYKISFEEPPPIRNFVPGFPEALQTVITRILHKDRELRYQSLKDVQFDVEPIRLDLQRQRAAVLLTQAQELFEKKQLDPAQTVIMEALGLDPSNTRARLLRENLQKQLQQRTLQPRIESLLNAGEEHMAQRRFSDALQSFESALRLDRDNAYIQSRLEQARGLLEHSRTAATLVSAAREEFRAQNFTAAYRSISEALRHDPQNPEAAELLKTIQEAVERRQQEERIDDAIRKAEGLILLRAYDEAIEALTALGAGAQAPKVERLLEWIEGEKKEQDRKQRLQSEMAASTDLLRNRRVAEAAERLEKLHAEFSDNREVADLLAYAQKEVRLEARAKAVEQLAAKAAALSRNKEFDAAMAVVDDALKRYPGENSLIRLLAATMEAKADWERRQAVEATLRECGQLRAEQRFAEAIEKVEATLHEYSAEPALAELLEALEKDWAGQRRAEAVRKAADQAHRLLAQNRPGEAASFLQQTAVQYPGEPDLTALLDRAQQEVRAIKRAEALAAIGREAARLAEANEFDRALVAVEQGLTAWPDDEGLRHQRDELQAAKAAWDRRRTVQEAIERARQFAARKQFTDAQHVIEVALRKYPEDRELAEAGAGIAREAEERKRAEAIQGVASEVRLLISRGRLDEALDLLQEASRKYPGDPELEPIAQQARQAVAERQRAQTVERLVRQSDELSAARQYDRAREVLERALGLYPGELGLVRQLNAVKSAAAAWERDQAVQQIVSDARSLAKDGRFETALHLLATSPVYSPTLLDAQRELERERDQHERREAIGKAVAGVNAMLERGRPEEAIKVLRELATQYPGEPQWEPLAARAQEQAATRKRAEERKRAVQEAVRRADALAGQQQFESALRAIEDSLRECQGEPALVEAGERVRQAWEQRKRADAVAGAARAAEALMAQGRYEGAIGALREAGARYPGEAALTALLAQAEEALAARERRSQVLSQAAGLLQDGRPEQALELLRPLAARSPSDAELASLVARAQAELELRRREEAVAKVAAEARALVGTREFDRALAVLDRGLQSWPKEQRLLDAREAARSAQAAWQREQARLAAIEFVRKLQAEGRFTEGLDKAAAFLREHPGDAGLLQVQKELRMRQGLAEAKALLARGNPAEALRLLEGGAADFGEAPEWAGLTARASGIRDALAQCERLEQEGRLPAAMQLVERMLREFPEEPAFPKLRDRIQAVLEEQERHHARQHDLKELAELEEWARRASGAARTAEVLELARRTVASHPGDTEVAAAGNALIAHLQDIENARGELGKEHFAAALEISNRNLAIRPGHAVFTQLKEEAERGQKAAYLAGLQHRAGEQADLAARVRMLQEGLERYPEEPWISGELRLTANKLSLVESILEKARAAEAAGEWEQALEQWTTLATVYSRQPGIEAEIQRVQAARDRARADATAGWTRRIEEQIQAGEPGKARELLRQALTELPDEAALQTLGRRIEDARQKSRQARDLLSQAQAARDAGKFEECRNSLRQALALAEHDATLRRQVLSKLAEHAEAALETDWRQADSLIMDATALHAGFAAPDRLLRAIADRKKDSAVDSALAKAEQLRGSGDLRGARAELDRALQEAPGEPRLSRLREALTARIEEERQRAAGELRQIREAAARAETPGTLEPLAGRASEIAREIAGDAELAALAAEVLREIAVREKQLRRTAFWARTRSRRKQIAGVAAGFLLTIVAVMGARQFLGRPPAAAKAVRTPPVVVPTVTAQVLTNFASGRVFVDGRPAGDLKNSQFALDALPFGAHTITVSSGDEEARVSFTAEAGRMPSVTGKVETRNAHAVVLSSSGTSASIACDCPGEAVLIDGKPAGRMGPEGLTVSNLAAGTRELQVGALNFVIGIRPEPSLNLLLSSGRRVGTLVVETNADDATVLIDGKAYGTGSRRRPFQTPLDAGNYKVEVRSPGFKPPPAIAARVENQKTVRLSVTLESLRARLRITGGMPASAILVDGRQRGTVDAGGEATIDDVPPGVHSLELARAGYVSRSISRRFEAGRTVELSKPDADLSPDASTVAENRRKSEKADWDRVDKSNRAAVQQFLARNPAGSYAAEAKAVVAGFDQQAETQRRREAQQRDDADWAAVNQNDRASVQQYLERHPGGRHGDEARVRATAFDEADRRKADAQEAQRAAAQQQDAEARTRQAAEARARQDAQDIRRALGLYEAAYRDKNAAAVRSVFPQVDVPVLERRFKQLGSVELRATLKPLEEPKVNGNTATVRCEQAMTVVDGRMTARMKDVAPVITVVLKRSATGWVIDSFQ
jgi:eukaryotic-like serine/threonine-protein kinase